MDDDDNKYICYDEVKEKPMARPDRARRGGGRSTHMPTMSEIHGLV